jgi:hypothetical protein
LLGEHELRFRKSTERMQVPDWYKDYYNNQQQQQQYYGPLSATNTSGVFSAGTAPTISTGVKIKYFLIKFIFQMAFF